MLSFIIFTILLNYPERIVVRYGEFWPQLYYRQDIACDMHCAYARERFTVYTYAVLSLCMVGPHWRETRFSLSRVMLNNMIISAAIIYVLFVVKPFSASVRERQLRATWALLLWTTWLAAAVRESTLLFVTERGLRLIQLENVLLTPCFCRQ